VYHVDLQFSVDQRVYWCRSTPSKLPDDGPIMFVSMVAFIRVTLIDHDRLLCISMAWASPLSYSKSRARCL